MGGAQVIGIRARFQSRAVSVNLWCPGSQHLSSEEYKPKKGKLDWYYKTPSTKSHQSIKNTTEASMMVIQFYESASLDNDWVEIAKKEVTLIVIASLCLIWDGIPGSILVFSKT